MSGQVDLTGVEHTNNHLWSLVDADLTSLDCFSLIHSCSCKFLIRLLS